jgi:glycyl-tRNA synthetase beta chain
MPQLLIELLSEEIPARMQLQAARDFERLMSAKLISAGLTFDAALSYVGPRRLVLRVEGLPAESTAVREEVKGPREGAPPQALEGFLRKVGLTQDALTIENGVYMARIEKPGVKTADVLGAMLREVILSFPWPKSMRSGTSSFRWVRPLKRILFLFDGAVIPFELEGIVAGDLSEGHRFLSSGQPFAVSDFFSYEKALADNFVILDHQVRQDIILEAARNLCADAGCELIEDHGLLEEVAGLNEYPVPLLGDMDPTFLTLPPEVIRTSMRTHQKYFAVRSQTGKMAPHFLLTANMKAIDNGAEIKRGNAKVLSARLSDGVFFWNEDNRAGNFEAWLEKLKGTTFHVKLGTMAQRVERITALAGYIAEKTGADVELTKKAARLAKADLASHMVMEFPELQGVMGGYYADALKLEPEVADAIREHYKPQGPNDTVPTAKISAAVALADKIDTLVGFFAIDEKPTGSKDPYALRRSALGILRIIRDQKLRILLDDIIDAWFENSTSGLVFENSGPIVSALLDFFTDRLKVQLREEGRPLDVIEAVLALKDDDIVRVINRIEALEAVKASADGENLVAVYKRAANILAAAKWDRPAGDLLTASDAPSVESALIEQLKRTKGIVSDHLRIENYREALLSIAALRQNVDAFLDGVLVNDEDAAVRSRRLNLLANVCGLSQGIADLSKLA